MSDRLETLDGTTLDEFLAAPAAVLILAKTTCEHCRQWGEELDRQLGDDQWWPGVRFGKVYLDRPGLVAFKRANPWLAEVADLPTNVLYVDGQRLKTWAGGGTDRLDNRLKRQVALQS
jgi:hypothetical protein